MIRSKQLDELKVLNRNLRSLGIGSKPDLENHVMMALVSGEIPKMKPVNSVSAAARKAIVSDRYNRHLSFADVFASTNGYTDELKQWEAHEKNRLVALSKYDKQADKIMLKALDADADAAEISEHLHEAAEKAGLKALKAPVFE